MGVQIWRSRGYLRRLHFSIGYHTQKPSGEDCAIPATSTFRVDKSMKNSMNRCKLRRVHTSTVINVISLAHIGGLHHRYAWVNRLQLARFNVKLQHFLTNDFSGNMNRG